MMQQSDHRSLRFGRSRSGPTVPVCFDQSGSSVCCAQEPAAAYLDALTSSYTPVGQSEWFYFILATRMRRV